ncbi:hypothetical protein FL966_05435 [Caproiciproducens galactitolivorans]|uniref:Glutamate synthase subunit beta n=1 Tax=Caproiciproducens galactitolivorans TaxID=642589 RepID=A0A4Z0Y1A8_9FIRM|nr:hypothetical protein [Caproiciproducens galactitolivorans]QEY34535.1 hypothetical protein FL966_05435 [Caproiciproducens galactitolivorans]TGJ77679.1 glutamate synthase subunit beta [Caproiciproducens galactitolivorans]
MIRISEIHLKLDGSEEDLKKQAAARLKVAPEKIKSLKLYKKSIDARRKDDVHFICTVEVDCDLKFLPKDPKITKVEPYRYQLPAGKPRTLRPVVVGFGPAGLFAALILAQAGWRPIVFERGSAVEKRKEEVEHFWKTGKLNPGCNVQFGEGGAGTFSDGKLNTGTKDPRSRKVLEEFAAAGAPPEILYMAKPHIGTDRLPAAVKAIREKILSLGGEVHFDTVLKKIILKKGKVTGVEVQPQDGSSFTLDADRLILAVGHSARDTFEMLYSLGIPMEQKPFSVGARIEHPQRLIDHAQYGKFAGRPNLGAADYKLAVHLENGRGVYTFCMCPGGSVVAAASEPGRLVTNGMSIFARDGENANAALLVGVGPQDFGDDHPLAGMTFQRRLEAAAFRLGGENYHAPAQRVEDFLKRVPTKALGDVKPTYRPGVTLCSLDDCLPDFITNSMRQGILQMNRKLKGFSFPDALLTAVETRSSSPVRMLRTEKFQSPLAEGLFPCGEGAGYAGGIISAAVDGIKCAEQVILGVQ